MSELDALARAESGARARVVRARVPVALARAGAVRARVVRGRAPVALALFHIFTEIGFCTCNRQPGKLWPALARKADTIINRRMILSIGGCYYQ